MCRCLRFCGNGGDGHLNELRGGASNMKWLWDCVGEADKVTRVTEAM